MNTARLWLSVALMVVATPGQAVTMAQPLVPGAAPAAAEPIGGFDDYSVEFVPRGNAAAFMLLPLRNGPAPQSSITSPALDSAGIGLSSVPDPGIWMMGLIGLAIVGANLRARQRVRSVLS